MSDNILVLIPPDPEAPAVAPGDLRARLRRCGFLGETARIYGDVHEMPGIRFCELLPFSPQPPPGLLHAPHTIELVAPTPEVEFLGGAETESPACSSCGMALEEWPDVLSAWYEQKEAYRWACSTCGAVHKVWQLNWRGSCGFGRQQVRVWHVGNQQAKPTNELLATLGGHGGEPWRYFFYHL